eukprot:15546428-Heterocapsa_arctica.AAC.1
MVGRQGQISKFKDSKIGYCTRTIETVVRISFPRLCLQVCRPGPLLVRVRPHGHSRFSIRFRAPLSMGESQVQGVFPDSNSVEVMGQSTNDPHVIEHFGKSGWTHTVPDVGGFGSSFCRRWKHIEY